MILLVIFGLNLIIFLVVFCIFLFIGLEYICLKVEMRLNNFLSFFLI